MSLGLTTSISAVPTVLDKLWRLASMIISKKVTARSVFESFTYP